MRALVQRVSCANVTEDSHLIAEIGPGMLVLLGIGADDGEAEADRMASKLLKLRIFEGPDGRTNESLGEREVLCVSQFTLYADTSKGNRPGFGAAAPPPTAEPLYYRVSELINARTGVFGSKMAVSLTNDGPFTVMIEVDPRT